MKNLILNTPNCRIVQTKDKMILEMKMDNGQWVRQMPYTNDLKGLVAALTLSIDVVAGKIWLQSAVDDDKKNLLSIAVERKDG
jgi:hypothetical protein